MIESIPVNEIGPVDVAIIVFDGNRFNGDIAPAIAELQQSGTVRIIDLAFVEKDSDGSTTVVEVTDSEVSSAFAGVTESQLDLLNDTDLAQIADGLEPGTSALAVVWENAWAGRLVSAIRASGGQVLALERIPHATVLHALAALDES